MSFMVSDVNFSQIEAVTYNSILKVVPNFISLDISKNSTGWVRSIDGIIDDGSFKVTADKHNLVEARREFRNFIIDLCKGHVFDYIFIEDVIGSVNLDTARILYQLNCIPDDMNDMGFISVKEIIREDNKVWKKHLKSASGYKSKIVGESNDKQVIRDSLLLLGYGDGTTDTIKEDIYDAYGLAVGVIFSRFIKKEKPKSRSLKNNVASGYTIKQFVDSYGAEITAQAISEKRNWDIVNLDFRDKNRDLGFNFKKLINDPSDESKVYIIRAITCKIGIVAVSLDFNLDVKESYLVIYRKKE